MKHHISKLTTSDLLDLIDYQESVIEKLENKIKNLKQKENHKSLSVNENKLLNAIRVEGYRQQKNMPQISRSILIETYNIGKLGLCPLFKF